MTTDTAASSGAGAGVSAPEIAERPGVTIPGWAGVIALIVLTGASIPLFALAATAQSTAPFTGTGGGILLLAGCLVGSGLTVVTPGTTKVLTYFGRYLGTVRRPGLYTAKPLTGHAKLSVRVRNFETGELKVNDADGNPINIAAIVVWKVADTAKATFAVEDYESFVQVQAESALRHVTTAYPYDGPDGATTLRTSTAQVSAELAAEVAERVSVAGVEILEVRISKLAYAPEIAQAMLQRQQAGAIIAARERIVEGAVSMVHEALTRLEAEGIVALDDERRAAMVSNLLVVLTGDQRATPVINTGTLYA
ncbi:MAG: SPFH domain-containing protein [Bifidobacteriaceae bacterium]|jgi:regulator of protease activity HflC (stomatin/prohibitin superfamily)|nr:SPFH domain-containing protein [Bifidobacteriaceae bacterium]